MPPHQLDFPYSFRPALKLWKLLFFRPGTFEPDPGRSEMWNRGAYIVNGPGHCSECHTPRNALGTPERDRFLAGTRDGPDGKPVPNITSHQDGIGDWSKSDLVFAFQTSMPFWCEVMKDGLSHLSREDLEAIAEYLLTVEPLPDAPAPAEQAAAQKG